MMADRKKEIFKMIEISFSHQTCQICLEFYPNRVFFVLKSMGYESIVESNV